jgi:tRNA threonylcarbamoyladenosine biosynthesis protein TsaB
MKILAIETSTLLGGIAILDGESGLIAEMRLNVKSAYSERLMTETDHILKQAGVGISDIDAFAISIGPGSFTGLRIGLGTVKGFSYATGKPIVTVPTLEALAWHFTYSRYPVCTMLDARKKEVYASLFRWEGEGFTALMDSAAMRVTGLLGNGRFSSGEKIIFTGEGSLLYKKDIISMIGERALFASPEKTVPSPAIIASIGMQKALMGDFSDPVSLVPLYIRRSEAERKSNV